MDVNPNQLLNIPKNMEGLHMLVWNLSILPYVYAKDPHAGSMGAVGINKSTGERQVTPRRVARWPACRWQSSVPRRWG